MLDYCAEHNIVSDVELIDIDYSNEAYEPTIKEDVHYRFVIDMASLKKWWLTPEKKKFALNGFNLFVLVFHDIVDGLYGEFLPFFGQWNNFLIDTYQIIIKGKIQNGFCPYFLPIDVLV